MLRGPRVLLLLLCCALVACQFPSARGEPGSFGSSPFDGGLDRRATAANPGSRVAAGDTTALDSCTESPQPDAIYLHTPAPGGGRLTPLDPVSLADQPGCAWLAGRSTSPYWSPTRRSESGRLIATIESDQQPLGSPFFLATVLITDALSGEERSRFVPPGPIGYELRFSPDGALLLVQGWYAMWRPDAVAWYVVETATGEVRGTIPAEPGVYGHPFFGAKDSQLYRLLYRTSIEPGGIWSPGSASEPGPWPLEIVRHDLLAGIEESRLVLPGVREGTWWSGRWSNDSPISTRLTPGAALSPDRRWLALAHADAPAVTVVDLEDLAVVRTTVAARSARQVMWWDALRDWAQEGLVPRVAQAKEIDGQSRRAQFLPDGRRLLVWGAAMRIDQGTLTEQPAPLQLFDLDSSWLMAELAVDSSMLDVLVSPDGQALYVATRQRLAGASTPPRSTSPPPYRLWRLEPTTLAVLAEREILSFPGWLYSTKDPSAAADALLTTSP
jgi:hypothetical protein